MEKKLLERKIDYLRWLLKHYLEEEVSQGGLSMDTAKEMAKTINKEITPELADETSMDNALKNIMKQYPKLSQDMEYILKESFWEEKREAVDYYVLPLVGKGKTDEALLILQEIINEKDSLEDLYSSVKKV